MTSLSIARSQRGLTKIAVDIGQGDDVNGQLV